MTRPGTARGYITTCCSECRYRNRERWATTDTAAMATVASAPPTVAMSRLLRIDFVYTGLSRTAWKFSVVSTDHGLLNGVSSSVKAVRNTPITGTNRVTASHRATRPARTQRTGPSSMIVGAFGLPVVVVKRATLPVSRLRSNSRVNTATSNTTAPAETRPCSGGTVLIQWS